MKSICWKCWVVTPQEPQKRAPQRSLWLCQSGIVLPLWCQERFHGAQSDAHPLGADQKLAEGMFFSILFLYFTKPHTQINLDKLMGCLYVTVRPWAVMDKFPPTFVTFCHCWEDLLSWIYFHNLRLLPSPHVGLFCLFCIFWQFSRFKRLFFFVGVHMVDNSLRSKPGVRWLKSKQQEKRFVIYGKSSNFAKHCRHTR